jgi:superfamily II DNA/RNA helicase
MSVSMLARNSAKLPNQHLFSTTEDVAMESSSSSNVDSNNDRNSNSSDDSAKLPELFPSLRAPLNELGFSTPTPIQSASAKRALALENLLLIAPTGSGKTLSYMLPALEKIVQQQKLQADTEGVLLQKGSNTCLVVAPTRELALQLMRDTTSILSNLEGNSETDGNGNLAVLLAVQGVQMPTTEDLDAATVLIGTPKELVYVLGEIRGGQEFLAGDVLSSVVLDEVDVLLPNPPKQLRTSLDSAGNAAKEKKGGKKFNTPQDERRRQEQKRKFMAAKRNGVEFSSDKQIVGPTETILKMIANRRLYTTDGSTCSSYQVLAGSATASRKTLDRLNKALRDAAMDASSNVDNVWNGPVKPCRPEAGSEAPSGGDDEKHQQDHTIRAVTVPSQVSHQYLRLDKDVATKPMAVLSAVAKASEVLKPKRALLFLCGEFRKQSTPPPSSTKKKITPPGKRIQTRGRQKTLKQKKLEAIKAARAKAPVQGLSARSACKALGELGIVAKPLHVALGLEANAATSGDDGDDDDEIPPFLVTFEGSARGLHLDDIDTVFVVGRPSSAAAYLHLAGRVGRSAVSEDGSVFVRPGNVVSFCTSGSSKELNKWTKQVGGTELQELIL